MLRDNPRPDDATDPRAARLPRRLLRLPGRLPAGAPGAARVPASGAGPPRARPRRPRDAPRHLPVPGRRAPRLPGALLRRTGRLRDPRGGAPRRAGRAPLRAPRGHRAHERVLDGAVPRRRPQRGLRRPRERPRGALAHPLAPRPQGVSRGGPLRLGHPLRPRAEGEGPEGERARPRLRLRPVRARRVRRLLRAAPRALPRGRSRSSCRSTRRARSTASACAPRDRASS